MLEANKRTKNNQSREELGPLEFRDSWKAKIVLERGSKEEP